MAATSGRRPPSRGGPERSPCTAPPDGPRVVLDASHGQDRWAQTGFDARTRTTNFQGLARACEQLGWPTVSTDERPLTDRLPTTRLLVVPPPTGRYDARCEAWRAHASARFTREELARLTDFVRAGGRLLAFSYRFGDSFTHGNLGDLLLPLGCVLNDDAVLDLTRLRAEHPLQAHFETPAELLPLPWSQVGVRSVSWRPMATFRLLPGAPVQPLALSPGGRCLSFDRARRQIEFASQPVAVAGVVGRGRFAAFGGPHAFESGPFGLLEAADNAPFLRQVLRWLLSDEPLSSPPLPRPASEEDVTRLPDGRTVAYVERLLRQTGMLKALSRARWLP